MISRLLLPSAVRLATYSCVRRSRLIRAKQIMYSARLASRLPPRLRRWRTTFPEEASTGDTPHKLAKEASLLNLWGLSPATISSVAAWSVPMPAKETSSGAACLTSRSSSVHQAGRSLRRGPRNGEPPNGGRTWLLSVRREDHLRGGSVQPRRRVPWSRVRPNGGAVAPVPSPASPEAG
jgi:hypothetical protein